MLLTQVCPESRCWWVVIGTITMSSWSRPKPVWPFEPRMPMTLKGTLFMVTSLPTADPVGKRFAATVVPRTATFDTFATSSSEKKRPWAMVQLPTSG